MSAPPRASDRRESEEQMAKKSKGVIVDVTRFESFHPDAAGIDVGAIELYVAVSADRRKPPNLVFKSSPRRTGDVPWEHATGITRQGYREPSEVCTICQLVGSLRQPGILTWCFAVVEAHKGGCMPKSQKRS